MPPKRIYQRRGGNPQEDKIFQGLSRKHKCSLCEHEFFVDELPGAISYKAILDLRKSWGYKVSMPSPSLMYQRVKLCVFCSQFFEHKMEPERRSSPSKKGLTTSSFQRNNNTRLTKVNNVK